MAYERWAGPRERPAWFDPANAAVLAGAGAVLAATGPRELEQATVDLLGPQIRRAVREERQGLWFGWWFEELVQVLAGRVAAELPGPGRPVGRDWPACWRLLNGMTGIGPPALATAASTAAGSLARRVNAAYRADPELGEQPAWLPATRRIAATDQVWQTRDVYGTRFGIVAGFSYPHGVDPCVFLFDIDVCGVAVIVANAGVYDDLPHAVTAWRAMVGDAADGAQAHPVRMAEDLACLSYWDHEDEHVVGNETDTALDNWFRTRRRLHDLTHALRKRRTPLPASRSLYHDVDTTRFVDEFTAWHLTRHGNKPDPDATQALAFEWLQGCLPGTEHAASPHRLRVQRALISDWIDDPVTAAAKALFPDWVRWHAEQARLPEHHFHHTLTTATATTHTIPDCGPNI